MHSKIKKWNLDLHQITVGNMMGEHLTLPLNPGRDESAFLAWFSSSVFLRS